MQVEHPRAVSDAGPVPAVVDVDGEHVPVDDDGYFELPDGKTGWLRRFATAHGVEYDDEGNCKRPAGWPEPSDADAVEPPFDPSDCTVDELQMKLDDGDYSDEELAALVDAERDGKDRETAVDAITAAREA